MESFYNGLNPNTRLMVDASTNRALLLKSYNEAYKILKRIANNNYQWPSTKQAAARGKVRVHNMDTFTSLSAKITSLRNMVKAMTIAPTFVNQVTEVSYVYCGERHLFGNYPGNQTPIILNGDNTQTFHGVTKTNLLQHPVDRIDLHNH